MTVRRLPTTESTDPEADPQSTEPMPVELYDDSDAPDSDATEMAERANIVAWLAAARARWQPGVAAQVCPSCGQVVTDKKPSN